MKIKRLGALICALTMFALMGCGGEKEGQTVKIPEGYTKEFAENMFWEKEDVPSEENGCVVQDMDIHIYNYCPSIFEEDENTRYAYYCSNRYSTDELKEFSYLGVSPKQQGKYKDFVDELGKNRITDYIAFRKGIKIQGEWYWSEKSYVLGPTIGSMTEGEQTCDPNVIKGEFRYNGENYSYLMAYLACATRDNTYNHVCLAVANAPEGPWLKCENINPFIEYKSDGVPDVIKENTYLWGYGQASMISLDKKGRVLMLYSSICPVQNPNSGAWGHATNTTVARFDMSDLNNVKTEASLRGISADGLIKRDGTAMDCLTNADYAYEPTSGRIYLVADGGGVAYVENKSQSETHTIGDVFFTDWEQADISWTMAAQLYAESAKYYSEAHNNCIIRDAYGWLTNSERLEVAITGSLNSSNYRKTFPKARDPLWSYRILKKTVKSGEGKE